MMKEVSLTFNHFSLGKKFNSTSDIPVDFSTKESGIHTVQVKCAFGNESLELPSFQVTKDQEKINPCFVDLKIIPVEIYFFYKDKPFAGADISGTFSLDNGTKNVRFITKTSDIGAIVLACPKGHLHIQAAKIIDGNEVKLAENLYVPLADTVNDIGEIKERKPLIVTVNKASNFILNNGIQYSGSVVFLGDCSGSMLLDDNIGKLRRTYTYLWEEAKRNGLNAGIAFSVWDLECHFCTNSWLSLSDESKVKRWISNFTTRLGNDMQSAITDVIQTFVSVNNIVVICDGDVTPFDIASWKKFRFNYPKIKFHFVAIGSSSNFEIMKQMAIIGNGSYTATNI